MVRPDNDEGGFTIVFPDLPGCMSCADRPEDVGPIAQEVQQVWLEAVEDWEIDPDDDETVLLPIRLTKTSYNLYRQWARFHSDSPKVRVQVALEDYAEQVLGNMLELQLFIKDQEKRKNAK